MTNESLEMLNLDSMTRDELKSRIGELEEEHSTFSMQVEELESHLEEAKEDILEQLDQLQELKELQEFTPYLISELEAYLEHLQTEYQTEHIREVVDRTSLYSLKEIIRRLRNA